MTLRSSTIPAVCALLCGLACLSSCKPARPTGTSTSPVAAVHEEGVEALTVARIGDRLIRFGEIEDRLDLMPVFVRVRHQSTERKLEFVEAYLQFTVLGLEAEARGLGRDGRVIDVQKDDLGERWLRRSVDLTVKTSDVADDDIVARYRSRWLDFNRPQQLRIRQVFVRERALADKLAFRIRKTMESTDANRVEMFEGFVDRWSEDPVSKAAGGAIGRFPRVGNEGPEVPVDVAVAAAAMTEPLSVSGVVEATDGFRILFVEAIEPAFEKSLEQARPEVVADLMGRERTRLRRERLDAVRNEIGVQVDDEEVRRVLQGRAAEGAVDG